MSRAVDLAHRSSRSATAFAVGAVIVADTGEEVAHGYSRDGDPHVHAEESALLKAAGDVRLETATLYSTLEPCTTRRSRPHATCASLIIAAGIPRVVFAWREPALFAACEGVATLTAAGVAVVELPEFAPLARVANSHLGF